MYFRDILISISIIFSGCLDIIAYIISCDISRSTYTFCAPSDIYRSHYISRYIVLSYPMPCDITRRYDMQRYRIHIARIEGGWKEISYPIVLFLGTEHSYLRFDISHDVSIFDPYDIHSVNTSLQFSGCVSTKISRVIC